MLQALTHKHILAYISFYILRMKQSRDTYRQAYWSFFSTLTFQTLHQDKIMIAQLLIEFVPYN